MHLRTTTCLLLPVLLLLPLAPARAVLVEYATTDLGAGTWRYDWRVTNDSLTGPLEYLTLYFDLGTTASIASATGPADWARFIAQPDPGIPDDGFVDFEALAGGIAAGAVLDGFSATFSFTGTGAPQGQFFEVYDPVTFDLLADGTSVPVPTAATGVPAPGALPLLLGGMLALAALRSRPRRVTRRHRRRLLQRPPRTAAAALLGATALLPVIPVPAMANEGGVDTVTTDWTLSGRQRLSRTHFAYTWDLAVTNTADSALAVERILVIDLQRLEDGSFDEYFITEVPGGFSIGPAATTTLPDAFTLAVNRRTPFDRSKVLIEVHEVPPPPPPPAPVAEVTGTPLLLGSRTAGCSASGVARIFNRGPVPLELTVSALQGDPAVGLAPAAFLQPGRSFTVPAPSRTNRNPQRAFSFRHDPGGVGAATATIELATNDPAQPVVLLEAAAETLQATAIQDLFLQQPRDNAKVDLLVTLDTSASMGEELAALRAALGAFITALLDQGVDFHLALVASEDGCAEGDTPFIDASLPAADVETILDGIFAALRDNSNAERGFTQAQLALLPERQQAGACNAGFLRDDARLELIHLSDEPEQSVQAFPFYVAAFQALKADPADVRINGIVGDFPSGCATTSAGTGYVQGAIATGGTLVSICSPDFGPLMQQLAADAASGTGNSFQLTRPAVPGSAQVTVDGLPADPVVVHGSPGADGTAALLFGATPPAGAEIRVDYRVPACD